MFCDDINSGYLRNGEIDEEAMDLAIDVDLQSLCGTDQQPMNIALLNEELNDNDNDHEQDVIERSEELQERPSILRSIESENKEQSESDEEYVVAAISEMKQNEESKVNDNLNENVVMNEDIDNEAVDVDVDEERKKKKEEER